MFTPGSKYFVGLTGLSLVSAILYAFLVHPNDIGAIALLGVAVAGGLISGFAFLTRDGDTESALQAVEANTEVAAPSFWPIVFALGAAVTLIGLATRPMVFVIGLGVLFGGGLEWTIQNWADRASADGTFNAEVRARAIGALDYPGLAAVALGVIAYLFSRIMLTMSKESAPVVFIVVAAAVLVVGVLIAMKPAFRGRASVLVSTFAVVLLAGAGIASAINGERSELAVVSAEDPYSIAHRECGEEASKHYDHLAGNSVSSRSAVIATIVVEDGKVYAQLVGLKDKVDTITIARSSATNILFRNLDKEERRLVANLGTRMVAGTDVMEKVGTCTQLAGENQEQILTINIPKPSSDVNKYSFEVPGIDEKINVVVP